MTTMQISIVMLIINLVLLLTVDHSVPPSPELIYTEIVTCLCGVISYLLVYMYLFIVDVFKEKKLRDDAYSGKWNILNLSVWIVFIFVSFLSGFINYYDIKGMSSIFRVKQYFSNFVFAFCMLTLLHVSGLLIHYLGRFLAGRCIQSKKVN
jgi:hypothetical protein